MAALTIEQLRRLRMRAQGLDGARGIEAAEVLRRTCTLQAQDDRAAMLGLRVRGVRDTVEELRRARSEERSLVWTWAMRGTLHYFAPEDVRWLLALHAPSIVRRGTARRRRLGWDDASEARGVRAIVALISKHGPRTRPEIVEELVRRRLPSEGQAPVHLLGLASLQARIVRGPDRGTRDAYALFDAWVPPSEVPPRAEALAMLARRYLGAYGPATFEDFRWWSGLPAAELREGWSAIEEERVELETALGPASMLASRAPHLDATSPREPLVRLLPAWDNYVLGYRARDFAIAPEHATRVHPGGGIISPGVLVDGRIVGLWRTSKRGARFDIAVEQFEPLGAELGALVEAEVADIGRFLGAEATLRLEGS